MKHDLIHSHVLTEMAGEIWDLAGEYRYAELDRFLDDAEETGNWQICLATLRYSFAFRNNLRNWHGLRDRSMILAGQQEVNVPSMFKGLVVA